jgi:MFS family permease
VEAEVEAGPAPDGGYGWVVVGGAFVAHVVTLGTIYSFGVFFPPMVEEFGHGQSGTAWVASIANAVMLGGAGITGWMAGRLGPSPVVAGGAVLVGAGLLLSSLATSLWQVYLAYGVLLGAGTSAAFLPCIGAVGQWFDRNRGLAIGVAVAGSGVGTVVVAPLSEALIDGLGWRSAARVLAGGGAVLLLLAAGVVRGRGDAARQRGGLGVWRRPTFRLLYAAAVVGAFGYLVPFVYLVPYARHHGISAGTAALLLALMGAANTAGRVVLGAAADRVGRLAMLRIATAAMTAAVLLWPLARAVPGIAAFAFAYGFFAGAFIALLPALTGDYFGIERLAATAGLLYTGAAVGSLLGAPAAGALFDRLGSYTLGTLLAGAALLVNTVLLLGLPQPERERPA